MFHARVLMTGILLAGLLALVPGASAVPALDATLIDVSDAPGQATATSDGDAWFVVGSTKVARVTPAGVVTEFTVNATSLVDVVPGPKSTGGGEVLWFSGASGGQNGLVEYDAATNTTTAHPIATLGGPRGLVRAPDGNFWVGDGADGAIEVGPDGTKLRDVAIDGSGVRGLAVGSDGRIWAADFGGGRLVAWDPADPAIEQDEIEKVPVGGGPQEIAPGPSGQLAFGNPGTVPQTVGRVTTGGVFQTTDVANSDPFGVALAADGAYWFAQFASGTALRLTPDGQTSTVALPAGSGPRYLTASGTTVLVGLETAKKIARITGVEPPPPPPPPPPEDPPLDQDPPPADTTAPVISQLALSNKVFRVGGEATAIQAAKRKRAPAGTIISFTLSEAPTAVTMRFERARRGRRMGQRCSVPTRANRRGRRCTRWQRVGRLKRAGFTGTNRVAFSGRVGRRAIPAGRYRLLVDAVDAAGNRAARQQASFRIVKRPVGPRHRDPRAAAVNARR